MNRYLITLALSIIVLSQTPALAWNSYGHMSIAYVAYRSLKVNPTGHLIRTL